MAFDLRPYQEHFVQEVRVTYRTGVRAILLVAATGSGKTVVFSYIARAAAAKGSRVLILAHRDQLIKQASHKLHDYGVEHGIIMAGFTPNKFARVQVASLQTIARRLKKGFKDHFDLIIVDEAHLSAAKSYLEVFEAFPLARILGVTGSPIRLDGKGLGKSSGGTYDTMVIGITIKELIEQCFLVRPAVFAPADQIDLSGVKKVGGDYEAQSLAEVMDKPKLTGDAITAYRKHCPGVPAVAWCVNVTHAEHVAAEFNAAGIPALALSGESTSEERDRALSSLSKGRIKVITFAMLLVEGVDCPAIGAIIMLRPTMSLASYLQVIGRGLRPIYADGMPLDTVEQRRAAIAAGQKGNRCFVLDHAGLTFRHGFADEVREWSLEGLPKKKGKKKDDEQSLKLKQCEKCFCVHEPAPVCPSCGHVYEIKQRGPEQVDGELAEITPEMAEAMKQRRQVEVKKAKTLEQLEAIAQQRGYSPNWAKFVFEAKQRTRAKYQRPEPPIEAYYKR